MLSILSAQILLTCIMSIVLFFAFETLPSILGIQAKYKKNFKDFLRFQLLRGLYATVLGFSFIYVFIQIGIFGGFISIYGLSTFEQVVVQYFIIELCIYTAHLLAHKYNLPLITRAHGFHHETKEDMDWVNSKKEHLLVIGLFVLIFMSVFFVLFKSSNISHVIVILCYTFLNALTHYRIHFTIPILDFIFLFPKDHYNHHTIRRSGPYGVTLSIFDTIFNTRK